MYKARTILCLDAEAIRTAEAWKRLCTGGGPICQHRFAGVEDHEHCRRASLSPSLNQPAVDPLLPIPIRGPTSARRNGASGAVAGTGAVCLSSGFSSVPRFRTGEAGAAPNSDFGGATNSSSIAPAPRAELSVRSPNKRAIVFAREASIFGDSL